MTAWLTQIEQELDQQGVDSLIQSIGIPPCPALLLDLRHEMAREDPNFQRMAHLISRDVALAGTLLKAVNSPFFHLSQKADTVGQALALLGMERLMAMIGGCMARHALQQQTLDLERFWDVSAKRAAAMSLLARELRVAQQDVAYTFGLFCDLGIPLMWQRFSDYRHTLRQANDSRQHCFTVIEDQQHQTNHALVGAIMAKSWHLPQAIVLPIRLHHDYTVFNNKTLPQHLRSLVALALLSEHMIQSYQGQNYHVEWYKGGEAAMGELGISVQDRERLTQAVHLMFAHQG